MGADHYITLFVDIDRRSVVFIADGREARTVAVFADKTCGGRHRHVRHQRHGERLERQCEDGAFARPGDIDLADTALAACDARHTRGEERLMLEEVEAPPRLLGRVVHRAAVALAIRTREARTSFEVDADIEPLLSGIKGRRCHEPGRGDAESKLEEVATRRMWKFTIGYAQYQQNRSLNHLRS